jgi:hypothetical protein
MSWMNTWEIDEARERWQNHPTLGPATFTLAALRDWVNGHSDGWHMWNPPSKAADKLQAMIHEANLHTVRFDLSTEDVDLSEQRLKMTLRPIRSFRTRARPPKWGMREPADFPIAETQAQVAEYEHAAEFKRRQAHIALAQVIADEYSVTVTPGEAQPTMESPR